MYFYTCYHYPYPYPYPLPYPLSFSVKGEGKEGGRMGEFRTYTHEVSRFLKEGSCSSLVNYLESARLIRDGKMDDADVIVSYWIMREDTPKEMRHLIPEFDRYIEIIKQCGISIDRILPEFNLDRDLYEKLVEPLKGA